jgi:hypothetical protein
MDGFKRHERSSDQKGYANHIDPPSSLTSPAAKIYWTRAVLGVRNHRFCIVAQVQERQTIIGVLVLKFESVDQSVRRSKSCIQHAPLSAAKREIPGLRRRANNRAGDVIDLYKKRKQSTRMPKPRLSAVIC